MSPAGSHRSIASAIVSGALLALIALEPEFGVILLVAGCLLIFAVSIGCLLAESESREEEQ